MFLYLLGGSIKLKYITFSKKKLLLFFAAVFYFMTSMIIANFSVWGNQINLKEFSEYAELNTLYTLSASLLIFYVFKDLKIKSFIINGLASSMFGVYLLSDYALVRPILWHTWFEVDKAMNSPWFIGWSVILSLIVFGICVILDKLLSLLYTPFIHFAEKMLFKIKPLQKYF